MKSPRVLVTALSSQLLSHTSGQQYDLASSGLLKWRASKGQTGWQGATVVEKIALPLLFQPGEDWAYGGGPDWAGKIVERVTHSTLEDYMQKEIWRPLSIGDITFWPNRREDLLDRMADISILDSKQGKAMVLEGFDINYGTEECLGGGGAFASPRAFFQLLHAILREDDRLLNTQSYQELFRPQLDEHCEAAFNKLLATDKEWQDYLSHNVPKDVLKSFTFAGMICLQDQPGWTKESTIVWGGLPYLVWVRNLHLFAGTLLSITV